MRMGYALAAALSAVAQSQATRIYGAANIQRYLQRQKNPHRPSRSIAENNRHGGPHLHAREIARRLRQADVAAA